MRWARRVILFLLLGAIVNVGVAWGCASMPVAQGNPFVEPIIDVDLYSQYAESDWPVDPMNRTASAEVWQVVQLRLFLLGGSADSIYVNHNSGGRDWAIARRRFGVPMRCMEESVLLQQTPFAGFERGDVPFPTNPLLVGFIVNTFSSALLLWLICAVFVLNQRRRRLHRGECARCRYPLGVWERCPECGTIPPDPAGLPSRFVTQAVTACVVGALVNVALSIALAVWVPMTSSIGSHDDCVAMLQPRVTDQMLTSSFECRFHFSIGHGVIRQTAMLEHDATVALTTAAVGLPCIHSGVTSFKTVNEQNSTGYSSSTSDSCPTIRRPSDSL